MASPVERTSNQLSVFEGLGCLKVIILSDDLLWDLGGETVLLRLKPFPFIDDSEGRMAFGLLFVHSGGNPSSEKVVHTFPHYFCIANSLELRGLELCLRIQMIASCLLVGDFFRDGNVVRVVFGHFHEVMEGGLGDLLVGADVAGVSEIRGPTSVYSNLSLALKGQLVILESRLSAILGDEFIGDFLESLRAFPLDSVLVLPFLSYYFSHYIFNFKFKKDSQDSSSFAVKRA